MKNFRIFFFIAAYFLSSAYADVSQHFDAIRNQPEQLYSFLKKMPKGGELHYHLAGGAYPKMMLSLLMKHPYCFNPKTAAVMPHTKSCNGIKSHLISRTKEQIARIMQAWSMQDFDDTKHNGHDHFFATFEKFYPIVSDFRAELLVDVMKRAAQQNEQYLEIMILPDDARSASFGNLITKENTRPPSKLIQPNQAHLNDGTQQQNTNRIPQDSNPQLHAVMQKRTVFQEQQRKLLNNKSYRQNIQFTIDQSEVILSHARRILGCHQKRSHHPACNLTIKFQYYILREQPIDNFFAQALNGFVAASFSNEIVGINVVQAEDGPIAVSDYKKQMAVLGFLHDAYPSVNIALHAGEITSKIAPKKALQSHIQNAIFKGKAKRIGHGVSIFCEKDRNRLVKYMAENHVPVEINLTSNQKILDVFGSRHPLNFYIKNNIPVVLSTDDEGILQTDLTSQYHLAVEQHQLDYTTLKKINRNALTYSFLPGESLWQDANKSLYVEACQDLASDACHRFIKNNPKATLQWELENRLLQFEKEFQ